MFTIANYTELKLITNNNVEMKFNWQNKVLLVIEDDYVNYLFLKEVLSETKIKIKRAISVKQALNLLASKINIDLIIINLGILENEIYKSISEIKSRNKFIPVIAIMEQYSIDAQSECIEAGCDTYINRHIDSSQLLLTIDELLDKSSIINSLVFKERP